MDRLSSRTRVLVLLLLLAAWAWRLHGLDAQSLWRDETDSLRFATRPLAQVLGNFTRPGENGPLYFLLLRPWLTLAGHSEYALRFPSALAGLLALPLILVWGRRLFALDVGLLAALLLAVNPYHLWYSQEAKMYALLVVVVMLALWAFAQALRRGGWWRWLIWLALSSACLYVHVLGVLVLPVQMVWFLVTPQWRRRWRSYVVALAVLVLPYVPLVWWQWALLTNPDFRTGHPFVPLDQLLLTIWSAQIQGIPQRPSALVLAPPIFLLLAALFLKPRQETHLPEPEVTRPRLLCLSWWLIPVLGVFLISLVTPIFTDRYVIWVLPALLLLLALGAHRLSEHNRWLAAVVLAMLLGFQVWVGWQQSTTPIKSDFRSAAAYVTAVRRPEDITLFLIPYIRSTYEYYDPGPYPAADAPYANREPDASLAPDRLRDLVQGHAGVWVIESEADFYDRQGHIRAWLEANGQRDDEAHFALVSVYHYRLP